MLASLRSISTCSSSGQPTSRHTSLCSYKTFIGVAHPTSNKSRGRSFIRITRYGVLKKKPARGGLEKNLCEKKPERSPVAFKVDARFSCVRSDTLRVATLPKQQRRRTDYNSPALHVATMDSIAQRRIRPPRFVATDKSFWVRANLAPRIGQAGHTDSFERSSCASSSAG